MSHGRPRALLVCYDVRDPKRLRRVYQAMREFGDHVQYSVFRCVLSARNRALMEATLLDIIHAGEDQVLVIELGEPERAEERIRILGQPLTETERVVRVVG